MMIDGLKLAMSGEELILALNERIDRHRCTIQHKRDLIDGKVDPPKGMYWQASAENIEDEIRQHKHRIDVLTMIRGHILAGETYLIGRRDLAFAELLPDPPDPVEWDTSNEIPGLAQSPQSEPTRVTSSSAD